MGFKRNEFGVLLSSDLGNDNDQSAILLKVQANELIAKAVQKGKLPRTFDLLVWTKINNYIGKKRIGTALYHDLYDMTPDGKSVLVNAREVEGTRYGIKTTANTYYLLHRHGVGIRVELANKAVAAKAAKSAGDELGIAIDILRGKAKLVVDSLKPRKGYKLVKNNQEGALVSVWDSSEWMMNVRRGEKASNDHSSGFYYYKTINEALTAAQNNDVFGYRRSHKALVLIEVEATGVEYELDDGKLCTTYLKPIRIVANLGWDPCEGILSYPIDNIMH
nr:hypothetical protein [uncultured Tolumonas sp.]